MGSGMGKGDVATAALPDVIPLFPLPNAVLFPGVPLPLHIFEPRYREMVRDVTQGEDNIIGMVLLRGDWRRRYYEAPEVFPVGCAGRIVSVEALPDGRFNVLLQGLSEFRVLREHRERSYRRASVEWLQCSAGLPQGERERLRELVYRYLGDGEPRLAQKLLEDASIADDLLVNFLCYALKLSPIEKQALIEATSLAERAQRLCDVMQFALDAGLRVSDAEEPYH
jgi:uncharacterized protein